MGRSPCCEKVGLNKGSWTSEEDKKLLAYIEEHGHGSWRALPIKAGLQRCGKSCRLRWTNYLRPDIKRGKFSLQEEQTIIQLHALLGNRWSTIATHLPKRTDNEIKNHWNTHLKKRLTKMGFDPVTHKPKTGTFNSEDDQPVNSTDNHMAQWESARLEAETRLAQKSKIRSSSSTPPQHQQQSSLDPSAKTPTTTTSTTSLSTSAKAPWTTSSTTSLSAWAKLLNRMASQAAKKALCQQPLGGSAALATASRKPSWLSSSSAQLLNKVATQPATKTLCIQVLRSWLGVESNSTLSGSILQLGSPNCHESTLNFPENISMPISYDGFSENSTSSLTEIVEILSNFQGEKDGSSESCHDDDVWKAYEKCLEGVELVELDDQWTSFESVKVGGGDREFNNADDGIGGGDDYDQDKNDYDIGHDHSFLIDDQLFTGGDREFNNAGGGMCGGDFNQDDDHSFTGGDREFNNADDGMCGGDFNQDDDHSFTGGDREFNNADVGIGGNDDYDQDKNYWNNIFDLVIASPSESPKF